MPWARKGSAFTLLFEQAALVREMSVNAAARIIEITDKRLWRIVEHYVGKAVSPFNLSDIEPVGLDEAASKRGRNYATVFIDTEKRQEPVVFATPGKGKQPLKQFSAFLDAHEGDPANIREAVFDMSPAFLSGVAEELPNPQVTQACLRPRDRFWDIPVPKIDSAFGNLLVPQPSWSPSTTQQLRKLVAAPYLAPNDWAPRSEAYFVFPLAQGTPGKQCGLAATGVYQPSLRSPWLAAVDRFHIVQTFTKALDEVRKQESRIKPLPKHLRWGVLKRGD
ncbi:transposase, partial [Thiolapillus sp.]|uniref:transposase n=1 Tax=Thiolapillus sp. TaxID=2017437 RepID=UPI003AF7F09A